MHDVPPCVWWKVGVFANNIRDVRLICRDVARLRPERTLLPQIFRWILDLEEEDWAYYAEFKGEFLRDVASSVRVPLSPQEKCRSKRIVYRDRQLVWPPRVYRLRVRSPRDLAMTAPSDTCRRTYRDTHVMYRLPFSAVHRLRKHHVQVLALVY